MINNIPTVLMMAKATSLPNTAARLSQASSMRMYHAAAAACSSSSSTAATWTTRIQVGSWPTLLAMATCLHQPGQTSAARNTSTQARLRYQHCKRAVAARNHHCSMHAGCSSMVPPRFLTCGL